MTLTAPLGFTGTAFTALVLGNWTVMQIFTTAAQHSSGPSPSAWETLGLTVTAGMLFLCGAIGAWSRAKISDTQIVFSQRTIVDMLIGGFGGVLLPVVPTLVPTLNQALLGDFQKWNGVQQAALAFFVGASGSYVWTVIGWRKGWIVTPEQASTGVPPPPPEPGVLRGSMDAATAAAKFEGDVDAQAKKDAVTGSRTPLRRERRDE